MRVLTVQQPWAWAIVHGGKDVENRTQLWKYRGPVAIHAGARFSDRSNDALIETLRGAMERDEWQPLTFGAVLGTVDLVDAHYAEPTPDCNCMVPYLDGAGNHSPRCAVFKGCCE